MTPRSLGGGAAAPVVSERAAKAPSRDEDLLRHAANTENTKESEIRATVAQTREGSAAPVKAPSREVHQRAYDDTLAVMRTLAAELARARAERARGEHRLADRREQSAKHLRTVHTRALQEQHGAEVARDWIARAEREVGL